MSEWQMDGFPDEMLYQARGITSNRPFEKRSIKNGVGEAGPREVDTYLHNPLSHSPGASGQRRGHHGRSTSVLPASDGERRSDENGGVKRDPAWQTTMRCYHVLPPQPRHLVKKE